MSGSIIIFILLLVTLGIARFLYFEWGKARKEAHVTAGALDMACKDVFRLEAERDRLKQQVDCWKGVWGPPRAFKPRTLRMRVTDVDGHVTEYR